MPGAIESSESVTGAGEDSCASGVGCGFEAASWEAALKDVSILSRENTKNSSLGNFVVTKIAYQHWKESWEPS